MGKKVYIDGNFLLKSGVFYGLNFWMHTDESFKDTADEHWESNEDGIYEVNEDGGSMFDTYFVKGGITMYGENGSTIIFFKNEHEHTYAKYKKIKEQITQLLEEAIVPQNCKNYFYQQQYISLFANLEYFLYNTFMWEVCQCYESYQKVLPILVNYVRDKAKKLILNGEHNILQEITFVEQVKYVTYHNATLVGKIYKAAFDMDVDLNNIEDELKIRHDIVHRAGYTKEDRLIQITKDDVMALKDKIDYLVDNIILKIEEFKTE